MKIKNRDKLLCDIADGIGLLNRTPVGCVEIVFICGVYRYEFELGAAIEAIANDLYFDERGDWCDATRAEVNSI